MDLLTNGCWTADSAVNDDLLSTFPSHVGRAVLEDAHLREAAARRALEHHDRATRPASWQMLAFCAVCRPDDQHDGVLLLGGAEDEDAPPSDGGGVDWFCATRPPPDGDAAENRPGSKPGSRASSPGAGDDFAAPRRAARGEAYALRAPKKPALKRPKEWVADRAIGGGDGAFSAGAPRSIFVDLEPPAEAPAPSPDDEPDVLIK